MSEPVEPDYQFTVSVDDEGVVRVIDCDARSITLTPGELSRLLTEIVKCIVAPPGDSSSPPVNINLN